MSTNVLRVMAEEGHQALPMPPIAYGLIAFVLFLVGLGVLWSFRNTGMKYLPPDESAGHRAPHGPEATRHH